MNGARSPAGIRGVLFDVDGTLYRLGPMRRRMMLELLLAPLTLRSWTRARRTWRILRCFRREREHLRGDRGAAVGLEQAQYEVVAKRLDLPVTEVAAIVEEWMFRRPLHLLLRCRRRGLVELLSELAERGLRLGTFSDYPVHNKLCALRIEQYFAVRLCATDARVDAFKPDPAGFQLGCQELGLPPEQVLYVGDRAELDAVGAAAAGMDCAIFGHHPANGQFRSVADVTALRELLRGS